MKEKTFFKNVATFKHSLLNKTERTVVETFHLFGSNDVNDKQNQLIFELKI